MSVFLIFDNVTSNYKNHVEINMYNSVDSRTKLRHET